MGSLLEQSFVVVVVVVARASVVSCSTFFSYEGCVCFWSGTLKRGRSVVPVLSA